MSASSPLTSKQKPMKRTSIRKHKNKRHTRRNLFFNKVVSYLLSDSYLYNPLVSPQPTFDFPPPKLISTFPVGGEQGDVALPIRGSNKKLIEKVVDFLEADCYLYSPLLTYDHLCSKTRPATQRSAFNNDYERSFFPYTVERNHDPRLFVSVSGRSRSLWGSENTETQGSRMNHREREGGELHEKPVAYRESVKHMVRQNYRTKSTQGASILNDSMVIYP
ncbi:hypothetical protein L1887_02906 [Cichorium endivia]|nr:hypothetical protein L1887_02906 [Cichorium endivia]